MWQDLVMGGAQVAFVFALLPALKQRGSVPAFTAWTTCFTLLIVAATQATLDLFLTAAATAFMAALWGIIAWRR